MKNNFEWFKLDNAAKIFPGQNSSSWSNIFRIGIELKNEIEPALLEAALKTTLKRIPNFDVRIRRGAFWYYLEKNPNEAFVEKDIKNHCYRIKFKEDKGFLFRLYYHQNRIAIDTYHVLSDGYGASVFLSTLAGEYLRLKGLEIGSNEFVLSTKEKPTHEQVEDSYMRYANSKFTANKREKNAYHFEGTKEKKHFCNYTIGIMDFNQVHEISRSYGVTVTEFFSALLLYVHYLNQLETKKRKKQDLTVQIPVNLRKAFPSKTLRNFVLCLKVRINPNLGDYSFEEILKIISLQLKLANDSKIMNSMMSQNLKIEKNPVAKFLPLPIKNFGIALSFLFTAEKNTTTLISNLGAIQVPQEMENEIEKYMFFTGPGKLNGARCGVITFNDKLAFTFSNCYKESDIEREFFTRLVKMGVHVKIESNRE
ncbi:MAG: hypothetical protein R3Y27_00775 [Clostridia bacterium]